MCIQNNIQDKIAELTNDGEHIAYFLVDTMSGASDAAIKICHRIDAAKMLTKYGIPLREHDNTASTRQDNNTACQTDKPNTADISTSDNAENTQSDDAQAGQPADSNSVVPTQKQPTLHDIISYPTARYIREHTDNGATLIQTLVHIMRGGTPKLDFFTGEYISAVKPHHRISAAKELLQRAFGETTHIRNSARIADNLSDFVQQFDETDPINTEIAKLTRDHTANGIEAAAFLIAIIDDGEEADWQPKHQLAAAKELLHRAYDLNYDIVTPKHIIAYNSAAYPEPIQEAAHKLQRRQRIQELIDAYDEARKSGDRQAANEAERAYHHYLKHGDDPDPDAPESDNYPADHTTEYSDHQIAVNQSAPIARNHPAAPIHTQKPTGAINNRSP